VAILGIDHPGGFTPEPVQLEQLRRELAGAAGFMEVLSRRG